MKQLILFFCATVCFVTTASAQQPSSADSLKQYVGTYKFPAGSIIPEVTVTLSDDGLLSMSSAAGPSSLEKKGEDLYSIVSFQGTAKFNRDSNKKIIGISIDARGYQLEGTKAENNLVYLYQQPKPTVVH